MKKIPDWVWGLGIAAGIIWLMSKTNPPTHLEQLPKLCPEGTQPLVDADGKTSCVKLNLPGE